MKAIWKYPLQLTERQELLMPMGSKFLCIQMQGGMPTIWALVDPHAEKIMQGFHIIGTGWEFAEEPSGNYLGTVQQGNFVWHLFED